jgi:hypothetical protein
MSSTLSRLPWLLFLDLMRGHVRLGGGSKANDVPVAESYIETIS